MMIAFLTITDRIAFALSKPSECTHLNWCQNGLVSHHQHSHLDFCKTRSLKEADQQLLQIQK